MGRNKKKFRMVDSDSYPIGTDPYQDIDSVQPPDFLNQLHQWFSDISGKIKTSVSNASNASNASNPSKRQPSFDHDFMYNPLWNTAPIVDTKLSNEVTKQNMKNIKWALRKFPYMGPETIQQQLYINQQTADELNLNLIHHRSPVYVFNITKSQHNYMLALYDAGVDPFTMSKLVLLLGRAQAQTQAQ
jgi:hypothetical protein